MTNESASDRLDRCRKHAEEHPDSARAQFNLGLAQTQLGKINLAEESYRKALELDPDLVEGWVNLGGTLLLKWDFKGALEANREALKRQDDLILAHYNMGQACLYLADAAGLEGCCRRVLELDPDHAAGHYYLAVGLLSLGRVEQAREALAKAMNLGHRPTPEFLRELERAGQETVMNDSDLLTQIGAEAPESPKEK